MSEGRNTDEGHPPNTSSKRRIFSADCLQQPHDQSIDVASTAVSFCAVKSSQTELSNSFHSDDLSSRDWHIEILSGLFLRSSEHELDRLEDELGGSQTKQHAQRKETDEAIHKSDIAAGGETKSSSEGLSILPLISSALRGMQSVKKRGRDEFDRPLKIPKSWRRPSYQSISLSELEDMTVDSSGKNGKHRLVQTGSLYPKRLKVSSSDIEEQSTASNIMPIFYNECSVSALANWAMMDPPDSIEASAKVTPMQSPGHSQGDWEAYTKELTGKITTNRIPYDVPVVGSTYRKCGVCEKFGHYEVECELLFDRDDDDMQPCGQVEGGVKKPGQPHIDEDTRRSIISTVAKEIRTQRRLQSVRDYCNDETASAISQNRHTKSMVEAVDEDNDYVGASITCNVCKSGLASDQLLMCDGCDELFHLSCLDPPLDAIPEGEWLCDSCIHYDSDDSVVEIEGCEEFVIEQRKRSMAESSEQFAGISLGHHKCRWTVASSVVEQSEPILDREYLIDHLRDGYDEPNFIPGKLCWVRRFNEQLDHPEWWPAMILQIDLDDAITVRIFGVNKKKNVSTSTILPYLPYYEDIVYKQLDFDCSINNPFRTALELSISALGSKTFGQVLKFSRSGIQQSVNKSIDEKSTNATGRLRSAGWIPHVGWERADIDDVDGYVILSREKRTFQLLSQKSRLDGNDNSLASLNPVRSRQDCNFSNFYLDEVIGGMVSWFTEGSNRMICSDEHSKTQYGVVLSVNPATEMALVRAVQLDEDELNYDLHSISTEIQIQQLGSTIWMPLSMLGFISSKPSSGDLIDFKLTLMSRMNKEMRSYKSRCKAAAVAREENTVELSFESNK